MKIFLNIFVPKNRIFQLEAWLIVVYNLGMHYTKQSVVLDLLKDIKTTDLG